MRTFTIYCLLAAAMLFTSFVNACDEAGTKEKKKYMRTIQKEMRSVRRDHYKQLKDVFKDIKVECRELLDSLEDKELEEQASELRSFIETKHAECGELRVKLHEERIEKVKVFLVDYGVPEFYHTEVVAEIEAKFQERTELRAEAYTEMMEYFDELAAEGKTAKEIHRGIQSYKRKIKRTYKIR